MGHHLGQQDFWGLLGHPAPQGFGPAWGSGRTGFNIEGSSKILGNQDKLIC